MGKKSLTLIERFLDSCIEQTKNSILEEVKKHAQEYSDTIRDRIILEAMKNFNNLRIDCIQSMGSDEIQFKIRVQKD